MNIDYISDLHIDFWCPKTNPTNKKFKSQIMEYIKKLNPKTDELLIIAGDLGHFFEQDKEFLLQLKMYYNNICIVAGNHDLYLVSNSIKNRYKQNSLNRIEEMKQFCSNTEGFYYLDGDVVTINNIKIGGVGMWHDFSYAINKLDFSKEEILRHWKNIMNDSNLIFLNQEDSKQSEYYHHHKVDSFNTEEYFQKEYNKLEQISSCDIMISHYGPKIPYDLNDEFKASITTTFYYFDGLKDIKRINPKYWIYGHTHRLVNEIYENTNLLCNPRGYPEDKMTSSIQTLNMSLVIDR